jgi:hypothetical protein
MRLIVVAQVWQYGVQILEVWEGERQTDFVLSGPYGVWVDILLGKLGASKAFVTRKLKVRGSSLRILQSSDSTMRWLDILRTIPTEFEGSYARNLVCLDEETSATLGNRASIAERLPSLIARPRTLR